MRLEHPKTLFMAAASLALATSSFTAPLDKPGDAKAGAEPNQAEDKAPAIAPTPRPIRLVAQDVVKKALLTPTDTARRISVMGGIVGLGSYNPRGGDGFGKGAPPRDLFPRVGVGNSLNVDPMTGRSLFTNMP